MTHMEWPYFELVYFIYVKGTKEFDETICSAERTCDKKLNNLGLQHFQSISNFKMKFKKFLVCRWQCALYNLQLSLHCSLLLLIFKECV